MFMMRMHEDARSGDTVRTSARRLEPLCTYMFNRVCSSVRYLLHQLRGDVDRRTGK